MNPQQSQLNHGRDASWIIEVRPDVVTLIDLYTVASGYLVTDLADCIRSICNIAGEEPKCKDDVIFDINSCRYFLKGYFSISNE